MLVLVFLVPAVLLFSFNGEGDVAGQGRPVRFHIKGHSRVVGSSPLEARSAAECRIKSKPFPIKGGKSFFGVTRRFD